MKKLLSCFICFMMLVGVSGCGNDDSKNNKKEDTKKTKENTEKKDEGSSAEKKKLKAMAPDPNDMLGDARIGFEEYVGENHFYRYKIDNAKEDFYNNYIEACENGSFSGNLFKSDSNEYSDTKTFEASTDDGQYWIQIIYNPSDDGDESLTNIYIGVENDK